MHEGIVSERRNLGLDRGKDAGYLGPRSLEVLGREHPERHRGDTQFGAPVQDLVELVGATLIDLAWIAQASLAGMAAISVQDDADVARHRPLRELMKEAALVNPIKGTQEQRSRRALVGRLALRGALPGLELRRASSSIKKGRRNRAFVGWAATGIHARSPLTLPPHRRIQQDGERHVPYVYASTVAKMKIAQPSEELLGGRVPSATRARIPHHSGKAAIRRRRRPSGSPARQRRPSAAATSGARFWAHAARRG